MQLFLTDYASYNEGSQFEFGHWVDLEQFDNAEEFTNYIYKHFKECDKKRPLMCGSIREEPMFTDFEGFPYELYGESMGTEDLQKIFDFAELEDHEQLNVIFCLENGCSFEEAMNHREDICMTYYNYEPSVTWELFEQLYPEAEENSNPYISINYDLFIKENFTEFDYNGNTYLIEDSWNY